MFTGTIEGVEGKLSSSYPSPGSANSDRGFAPCGTRRSVRRRSELGLPPGAPADLRGRDAQHNAQVVRDLVAGRTGPVSIVDTIKKAMMEENYEDTTGKVKELEEKVNFFKAGFLMILWNCTEIVLFVMTVPLLAVLEPRQDFSYHPGK